MITEGHEPTGAQFTQYGMQSGALVNKRRWEGVIKVPPWSKQRIVIEAEGEITKVTYDYHSGMLTYCERV